MVGIDSQKTTHSYDFIESLIQLDIDSNDIFINLFEQIKKYVQFDASTLYLLEVDSNKLEKINSSKDDVEIFSSLQVEVGDGVSEWSPESAQMILIADRTKKKNYNPDTDYASFLSIPIERNNRLSAVLNLGSYTKNNFTSDHIQIIKTGSPIISLIIEYYQLSKKFRKINSAYVHSVDQLHNIEKQKINESTIEKISKETAEVIHGINNSLSIILGNLQCLLIEKNELNQKSFSRLKRIEIAAKKVSDLNTKIMSLNTLVNLQAEEILIKIES